MTTAAHPKKQNCYLIAKDEPFRLSRAFCSFFHRVSGLFIKPNGYYAHAEGTSLYPKRVPRDDPCLLRAYDHLLDKVPDDVRSLRIVRAPPSSILVQSTTTTGERLYPSVEEAFRSGENPFGAFIRLADTRDVFIPAYPAFQINEHNDSLERLRAFAVSGTKIVEATKSTGMLTIVAHKMEREARTDTRRQLLVSNAARLRAFYEQTLETVLKRIAEKEAANNVSEK